MRTINFYRRFNDQSPIEEFLDSLTGKQAQKVLWVLELIEELETIPRQYFKKLVDSEGIWEVRVQFGNDIFRLAWVLRWWLFAHFDKWVCQENAKDTSARDCACNSKKE